MKDSHPEPIPLQGLGPSPILLIEPVESGSGFWDQEAGLHVLDSKHLPALAPERAVMGSMDRLHMCQAFAVVTRYLTGTT